MLVLSRKKGETLVIDENIEITVLAIDGETVKLGISAPKNVDIYRKEIFEAIQQSNQQAAMDVKQLSQFKQFHEKKD
ncbi:carbon storage regulator CsrA [Paenibacillus pinistramenti]|uniref:carbon storage regulator CsrA n=1 Tax=Paenibacillus pinistramenti TaxID=1768003 RepID=UPI001108C86D|nr:carbon storage regulator CsrA [Paenibacillus pinistramenti]